MRGLYLVAAVYDPGVGIKRYAENALRKKPYSPELMQTFTDIVLGNAKGDPNLFVDLDTKAELNPAQQKAQAATPLRKTGSVQYYEDVKTEDVSSEGNVDDGFDQLDMTPVKIEEKDKDKK